MIQLFKTTPSKDEFITFIKEHCVKEKTYYKLTNDVYKKIIFKNVLEPFLLTIKPHYHKSKQKYIERKMTYTRFVTVIRHICKILDITYTSIMKYANSSYRIDYYIYLQ